MESKGTISVVINNYNYAKFLPSCIESVLGQTQRPDEIIVVDDGSTDDSVAILDTYKGKVHVILKENQGQASALNAGFEYSTGDWIHFLDADDLLVEDAIRRLKESLEDSLSKLHFPMWICGETGKIHGMLPKNRGHLTQGNALEVLEISSGLNVMPTSANLFSRKFLESIMPIPETDFRICADTYLLFSNLKNQNMGVIEERLACYRVHSSNWYNLATQFDFNLKRNLRQFESSYKKIELLKKQDLLGDSSGLKEYLAYYLDLSSIKNILMLKRHNHSIERVPFTGKELAALANEKIKKIPDRIALIKEKISLFIILRMPLVLLPLFSALELANKRVSQWRKRQKPE